MKDDKDEKPAKAPKERAPEAPAPTVYRVAPGRSITSRRGILTEGTEVNAERDGISDLDALVRIGAVVRG